jgi:capsid protein
MGGLQTRPGREDELHNIRWQPRRWEGPDPAKQAMADKTELANGTTALTQIAARKGVDFDDLLAERVAELSKIKAAAEAAGLEMADILPALFAQRPEQEAPNNDDD